MAWNEPLNDVQNIRLTTAKNTFNLNHRYVPGLNDLEVLLNGIEAVVGQDYDETNQYTVTFRYTLMPGDTVTFRRRK